MSGKAPRKRGFLLGPPQCTRSLRPRIRSQSGQHAAPVERAHHVNYKTGRDRNGNKILRCSSREGGGFTIQTNGNLPATHRDGVTTGTDAEVCAYVVKHGNARRKHILGI